MLSFTIGSSAGRTKNILTPPAINIVSFSYLWMRYFKVSRSRIAHTYLLITMRHSPVVGLRAITSALARYSRPDMTRRQEKQARPWRLELSLQALLQRPDNGWLRDL